MRLYILLVFLLFSMSNHAVEVIAEIPSAFQDFRNWSLTRNTFVVKLWNENDTEIWRVNPTTALPEVWLSFNEVKPESQIAPLIFASDEQTLWVGNVDWDYYGSGEARGVVFAVYQTNGEVRYVDIAASILLAHPTMDFYKWVYAKDADVLIGQLSGNIFGESLFMMCKDPHNLLAENCSYHQVMQGEYLFTEDKLVVYRGAEIAVYDLVPGLPLIYENILPGSVSNISYWPQSDVIAITAYKTENGHSFYTHWQLELPVSGNNIELTSRLLPTGAPRAENCVFLNQHQALCKGIDGGIRFQLRQPSQQLSVEFSYPDPNHEVPYGDLMAVTADNRIVTANAGLINVFSVVLPQVELGVLPEGISLYYQDIYTFDLAELFSNIDLENIDLYPIWQTTGDPNVHKVLQQLSAYGYSINTSKEVARGNPKGILQFSITDSAWQAYFNIVIQVININDAPQAVAAFITTETLEVGQSYELSLDDIFSDADLDPLIFGTENMPAEFALIGRVIRVTPNKAGSFSFKVSATDPSGEAAYATISGQVKAKENKSSGGSFSIASLFFLLGLLTYNFVLRWRSLEFKNNKIVFMPGSVKSIVQVGGFLLLTACSGGEDEKQSSQSSATLTLSMSELTIQADMLENKSIQQQIGAVSNVNAATPIYFHFEIHHSSLIGADLLYENGRVYARVMTNAGYSMVDLNQSSTLNVNAKVTACYDTLCAKQIKGSPANILVSIVYKPADAAGVPAEMQISSADTDNSHNSYREFVSNFTIDHDSKYPLVARVSHFSEELFSQVALARKVESNREYDLKLRFPHDQYLANKIHHGTINLQFCYDNNCSYPVKNGQRQLDVVFEQQGEPYKEYAMVALSDNMLPIGMAIAWEDRFLADVDILAGVFRRDEESYLYTYDIKTLQRTELKVNTEHISAQYSDSQIMLSHPRWTDKGMEYINAIYDWDSAEAEFTAEVISNKPLFDALIFDSAIYVYSEDSTTPYRYHFNDSTAIDYGHFNVSDIRFVSKTNSQLYNVYSYEAGGRVQRWDMRTEVPQYVFDKSFVDAGYCWHRFGVATVGKVINRCGDIYQLSEDVNSDFAPMVTLAIPQSHTINDIAVSDTKDEFVLVMLPNSNNCNSVKMFCGVILQRYRISDLSLLDEFSLPDWDAFDRMWFEQAREHIFYNRQGDKLFMITPNPIQLREIHLP